MSRTQKGSKGPGWEPWSNRHEKAEQKASYVDDEPHWADDECQGCWMCICVKCGDHMASTADDVVTCIGCGHVEFIEVESPAES